MISQTQPVARRAAWGLLALLYLAPAGAAELTARMVANQGGVQSSARLYVQGEMLRMEAPEQPIVTILHAPSGTGTVLLRRQKMYMALPQAGLMGQWARAVALAAAGKANRRDLGTARLDGQPVQRLAYTYPDPLLGRLTEWYSESLGFPLKSRYTTPSGAKLTVELKDVRAGPLDTALFAPPPDYADGEALRRRRAGAD